jgi:hypothetical protein
MSLFPPTPRSPLRAGAWLIAAAMALSGCAGLKSGGDSSSTETKPAASGGSTQASAPPAPKGIGPGMNANGEVVDSSKVESGYGKKIKGLGDWEGEITGKPSAKSKFTKLQIGMSMKQVTDLAGQPTDQGAYMTGKAWIPWYFGSDRHRFEMVYKGQGRLIFAGGSLGDYSGGNLIWIIHNGSEGGYR